jgi:hypothetical protein
MRVAWYQMRPYKKKTVASEWCHISRNLDMRANLPQEMQSFPTGDVSSPLEMRIPRTHIHISRERCGRISKLQDMWQCCIFEDMSSSPSGETSTCWEVPIPHTWYRISKIRDMWYCWPSILPSRQYLCRERFLFNS